MEVSPDNHGEMRRRFHYNDSDSSNEMDSCKRKQRRLLKELEDHNKEPVKSSKSNQEAIDLTTESDDDIDVEISEPTVFDSNNANNLDDDEEEEDSKPPAVDQKLMPYIGMNVRKNFEGKYYVGKVISGPEQVPHWKVEYEDGDQEDLDAGELRCIAIDNVPTHTSKKREEKYCRPVDSIREDIKDAKKDLMYYVGISEEEIDVALAKMKSPYNTHEAMRLIQEARQEDTGIADYEPVQIAKGLKIRKYYMGSAYDGVVTGDAEDMCGDDGVHFKAWEVTFEDGATEDLDFNELVKWRANRPMKPHPVRGRQLCALELFSGCGIVTQEFATRNWMVKSIDNSIRSHATNLVDIMALKYDEHLGMVPDFIWASPECITYSLLAGGKHRDPSKRDWDKTHLAHLHTRVLLRLMYIMRWAKSKNPHLIVVLENPVGLLNKMPIMRELAECMELDSTTVDYCQLGRYDKKPTQIWSNCYELVTILRRFKCKPWTCSYYGVGRKHPFGARGNGQHYNFAAIPQPLAEEVAECVHSEFYNARIRYKKAPVMTEAEILEFNERMAATEEEVELMESVNPSRAATEEEVELMETVNPSRAATAISSSEAGGSDSPMEEAMTDEANDTDW